MKTKLSRSNPLVRLCTQLLEEYRAHPIRRPAFNVVLAWLVAGRAAAYNATDDQAVSISDLDRPELWTKLTKLGVLPAAAYDLVWGEPSVERRSMKRIAIAVGDYFAEFGPDEEDPADLAWYLQSRFTWEVPALHPNIADLMVGALGEVNGKDVICFGDFALQLAVRAGRLGANVYLAVVHEGAKTAVELLRAYDAAVGCGWAQRDVSVLTESQERKGLVLGVAPFGSSPSGRWSERTVAAWRWADLGRAGDATEADFVRFILERPVRTAVLAVPQVLLYGTGRHRELRKQLLAGGFLRAALTLPPKSFSSYSLAPALLVLAQGPRRGVVLIELGPDLDEERVEQVLSLLEQPSPFRIQAPLVAGAVEVPDDELVDHDLNLLASRYIGQSRLRSLGPSAALGDLVEVIRAPVPSRNPQELTEAVEIGIPELDGWLPIADGKKTVSVSEPKRSPFLVRGDIVLSIKGTTGKVGLIGSSPRQFVVSQSCIGLRLARELDWGHSVFMFMFLRSQLGQLMLEVFRTGATVPQLNPNDLMKQYRVPASSQVTLDEVLASYQRLCKLERQIEELKAQLAEEASQRWRAESEDAA